VIGTEQVGGTNAAMISLGNPKARSCCSALIFLGVFGVLWQPFDESIHPRGEFRGIGRRLQFSAHGLR